MSTLPLLLLLLLLLLLQLPLPPHLFLLLLHQLPRHPRRSRLRIQHHGPQFARELGRFLLPQKARQIELGPTRVDFRFPSASCRGCGLAPLGRRRGRLGQKQMDGRAADDVVFEAQEGRDALFDPVLDDAAVDFGEVDFLGEVGGEGGGAEEF